MGASLSSLTTDGPSPSSSIDHHFSPWASVSQSGKPSSHGCTDVMRPSAYKSEWKSRKRRKEGQWKEIRMFSKIGKLSSLYHALDTASGAVSVSSFDPYALSSLRQFKPSLFQRWRTRHREAKGFANVYTGREWRRPRAQLRHSVPFRTCFPATNTLALPPRVTES